MPFKVLFEEAGGQSAIYSGAALASNWRSMRRPGPPERCRWLTRTSRERNGRGGRATVGPGTSVRSCTPPPTSRPAWSHHKFEGTESKLVLKRALKDVLPSEILGHTDKVGFATPIGHWLRAVMDRDVRPLLLSEEARTRHVFDRARLEDALRRLAAGDTTLGTLVFR